jgi:hypothetical protein
MWSRAADQRIRSATNGQGRWMGESVHLRKEQAHICRPRKYHLRRM